MMQQETSLDDHASDSNPATNNVPTGASSNNGSSSTPALEKDIGNSNIKSSTAACGTSNASVEKRRKELNELWHKLSVKSTSSNDQHQHQQRNIRTTTATTTTTKEEEEKKQGEDEEAEKKQPLDILIAQHQAEASAQLLAEEKKHESSNRNLGAQECGSIALESHDFAESMALNSTRQESLALSSMRLDQRTIVSQPIIATATAAAAPPHQLQQQQQQKQQQDYLRNTQAPNTAGQPRKAGTSWWERVVVQRSSYVVEDLVDQYTADSVFLQSPALPIAFLDRIELQTSQLLGSGTYSNVSRVQQLQLLPNYLADHPQQDELRKAFVEAPHQAQANDNGAIPASHAHQLPATASTGYAIKHLKSELLQNSKLFEAAAADLIMEAKFLIRLEHPNILRLRGMALGGTSTFAATGLFDSYFLVVDELQETLIQRIHRWKVQGSTDQYRPAMILEKLKLAVQVASALSYLHERRLVFRDLKPHNIGLKKLPYHQSIDTTSSTSSGGHCQPKDSNIIQLFDFGFCRELPNPAPAAHEQQPLPTMIDTVPQTNDGHAADVDDESRNDSVGMEDVKLDSPTMAASNPSIDEDQVFCMSGKGTLLYMAAEVLSSSRCYNQKADVYSWSMVTYELLTLQKPFAVGSIEQHKKAVCERGERPPMGHLRWLNSSVKELLQHSWQANVHARWHMRDIKDSLEAIIFDAESRHGAFRRDGSFGSFGYGTSAGGKKSSSSFNLCQGMDVDDIILDLTNTAQTRYNAVTGFLFCNEDTTTASVNDSAAAVVAGKTSDKNAEGTKKVAAVDSGREISLKSYTNTADNKSISFSQKATEMDEKGHTEDKKVKQGATPFQNDATKDNKPKTQPTGQEERKDEAFYTTATKTISKAVWGGFARPHTSRAMRPPTTAPTATEQDFSERSLSMHSERLQAAQNRRPTAWVTPSRLTSAGQSYNHKHRPSFDDFGRSRPYASRSLRAHSSKLDATIELENEDEEDGGKEVTENSLVLSSIRLIPGHLGEDHLEEIAEEAGDLISKGSSLRSTSTTVLDNNGMETHDVLSSVRSTSPPVPDASPSDETPGADVGGCEDGAPGKVETSPQPSSHSSLTGTPCSATSSGRSEVPPMILDPSPAPVRSESLERAIANAGKDNEAAELEDGLGSIALSSTRAKAISGGEPQVMTEDENPEDPPEDHAALAPNDKEFIVATASI